MSSSHSPGGLVVSFDDEDAVANAGLLLTATLAERLEIEAVIDQLVDLGERPGAYRPGRKVLTLVHALVAGGDCIDDADVLRTGATAQVLGHQVMAPSTLGTFLRPFTFGHVRKLDQAAEQILGRAWAAGAGPGDGPLTMDVFPRCVRSTATTRAEPPTATPGARLPPVAGYQGRHRRGAACPHAEAASGRGAERFVNELAGRVRRAGASGQLVLRADSGFWSAKVLAACRRHRIRFSVTVRQTPPSAGPSPPSPRTPGPTSTTPTAAPPRSPRPPMEATGSSCAVSACWARRPPCGPTGATTPLSPT
jgi:hypothetical protein